MLNIKYFGLLFLGLIVVGQCTNAQIVIDPPAVDSISVDTAVNGDYHCVLGWQLYDWAESGYDIDSSGFIVRDVIPGSGYANPDTLYDATATFYMDYSSDPFNEVQGYGLVAFSIIDGEFLKSKIEDQFSRNIRLQMDKYDSCLANVTLTWNDYYSDEAPLGTVEPEYTLLAISESELLTATTASNSYTFQNLNREETYWFRLHIETSDFTSSSNPVTQKITTPEEPGNPYIESLQTSGNYSNTGSIIIDDQVTNYFLLMGSTQINDDYDTVSLFEVGQNGAYSFSDPYAGQRIIYYYAAAYNVCGINAAKSDTINTILLSASDNGDHIYLQANDLDKPEADYKLYREADGAISVFEPNEIPISYRDYSVFDLTLSNPVVRYYVEANVGDSVLVTSNPIEVRILDDLLWPNAIIAGEPGMDGAFKPIPQRSIPGDYNLKIYNKWGDLIFKTDDVNKAWRARYKGNYVMSGGYLYVARYKFQGEKEKVVRGTVTVIH